MSSPISVLGMKWRGAYNPATAYNVNDVVTITGSGVTSSYIALVGVTGVNPVGNPSYWALVVSGSVATGLGDPGANSIPYRNGSGTTIPGTTDLVTAASYGGVASGSANALTATLAPAPSAYTVGALYVVKANVANTGAATINFNSLGAKTIKKVQGGVTTDLIANDIQASQIVVMHYDGTNMQIVSQLGNTSGNVAGAWQTPTLLTGWADVGGAESTTQYRIDAGDGTIIRLKGNIHLGGVGSIFVLAGGFRPTKDMYFASVDQASGYNTVRVQSGGSVDALTITGSAVVSLDGITFPTN